MRLNQPASAPGTSSESDQWWRYACAAAAAFRAGSAPPEIGVFGPVLHRGETAYFEAALTYSRRYGGDGSYSTTGLVALGSPALMIGTLAASGYVNHRRRVAAQRAAAVRWRDHQPASVIATSHRLLIDTAQHGLQTFAYSAVSEWYPDVSSWSLVLGFVGRCAPLLLAGPAAPAAALLVSVAVAPDRWDQDPRIAPLIGAAC